MLSDVLGLFAPIDWVIAQISGSPVQLALWSALCFATGWHSCRSVKVGWVHKRVTMSKLSPRMRQCLATSFEIEQTGRSVSVSGSLVVPMMALSHMGIMSYCGEGTASDGARTSQFYIEPDWKKWLLKHRDLFDGSEIG